MVPETRVFQAADVKDLVILACTVFDWSTRVPDGQTNRQTDGQNCDGQDALKAVAAFARRNRNHWVFHSCLSFAQVKVMVAWRGNW